MVSGATAVSTRDAQRANRQLIQTGFFRELRGPAARGPFRMSGELRNGDDFVFVLEGQRATMEITRKDVPWWWVLLVVPVLALGFASLVYQVLGLIFVPAMIWIMVMTPRWQVDFPRKSYAGEIAGTEPIPSDECVDLIRTWIGSYQGGLPINND